MQQLSTGVILVIFAGALAFAAEAPVGPEGDTGIASKYPGDAGMDRDPDIIMATSFEDGLGKGVEKQRKNVEIVNDPAIARAGNSCAMITAIRGQDSGGDLKHNWNPGVEQCFVRVYVRFHKDTCTPHHFVNVGGSTPTYKYRSGGGAGFRPPGDKDGHWGTTLEPPNLDKPEGWHFYTYWHEMHSWQTPEGAADGRENAYYGNNFRPDNQEPFPGREKWVCIEFMAKMNTIGKHDGEMAFWVDGKKVGHWGPGYPVGSWMRDTYHTSGFWNKAPKPFEGFSWRTDESLNINYSMLQWYVSNESAAKGTADKNICYFDNWVIAKKYIGPIFTGKPAANPPAAPAKEKTQEGGASGSAPVVDAKVLAEGEAGRLLMMARQAEQVGQRDVAAKLYAQIVEKYPGTEAAGKAKARLQ